MKAFTPDDRRKAIEAGEQKYGSEFFMVDPRGGVSAVSVMRSSVIAAPFRIRTEQDKKVFIDHANPQIPWIAADVARCEVNAEKATDLKTALLNHLAGVM